MSFLIDRCDDSLDRIFCIIGNICGWLSSFIWFIVLFPQIYKNYKEKSIEGISFVWAIMNFSASFINVFFVFQNKVPAFSYISAVYMPVIEFIFLCQFYIYSKEERSKKRKIAIYFLIIISIVLFANIFYSRYYIDYLEWISIILWSSETLPQIFLNFKLKSTSGLSNLGQVITFLGKTSDIISNYLLIIPYQYRYLGLFSTNSAYVVLLQVIYYHLKTEELISNEYKSFLLKISFAFISLFQVCVCVGFTIRIQNIILGIIVSLGFYIIIVIIYFLTRNRSEISIREYEVSNSSEDNLEPVKI